MPWLFKGYLVDYWMLIVMAIAFVGAEVKTIIGADGADGEGDAPEVVLLVVDADGEDGMLALNGLAGAGERVEFGALDVHFDEGWRLFS